MNLVATSAIAETIVSAPTFAKSLIGSSVVDPNNAANQMVIGETAQFRLVVTVPEATMPDATVHDALPLGVQFVSLDRVASLTGGVPGGDLTSSVGSLGNLSLFQPAVSGDGTAIAQSLQFNFGTLVNSNVDNSNDEQLVIEYTVRAVNILHNQSGDILSNTADFQWSIASGTQQTAGQSATVEIVEPGLDINSAVAPAVADAGETVIYTIDIDHNTDSDTDAYDITFSNPLPSQLDVVIGNVTVIHSVLGDITSLFEISGGVLQTIPGMTFDLPLDASIQVVINGIANTSIEAGETIGSDATVAWTSLDGAVGTERDGSGGVNDYAETATAAFIARSTEVAKSLVGTSVNSVANADNQAVVGELVRYSVEITVPEGTTSDVLLTDSLSLGLEFVSLESVVALSNGLPSVAVTSDVGAVLRHGQLRAQHHWGRSHFSAISSVCHGQFAQHQCRQPGHRNDCAQLHDASRKYCFE